MSITGIAELPSFLAARVAVTTTSSNCLAPDESSWEKDINVNKTHKTVSKNLIMPSQLQAQRFVSSNSKLSCNCPVRMKPGFFYKKVTC